MLRSMLVAFVVSVMTGSTVFAQMPGGLPLPLPLPIPLNTRGTPEDQRACHPDANKLCRSYVGDDMAVLRCFQAQRPKLTVACRQVLEKYGQ